MHKTSSCGEKQYCNSCAYILFGGIKILNFVRNNNNNIILIYFIIIKIKCWCADNGFFYHERWNVQVRWLKIIILIFYFDDRVGLYDFLLLTFV